ncbi:uncharacterized protein PHACADRAFT_214366 [Phanerochaete carnosa HHB-10118-sp]|uniref:Major facilitator superfamily (MFS) profile domain-containing protein n=1 Tax=Phanerochaete carnosa (strain HHB-10118-sp) TaxID=650164 RepID=K5VFE2_PHACS|nr:uncharacterized protein PHACADRAFT_214366 [Phanerochaete carnosa HHB-10118-sp]EKM49848.1 hypothetical protein PHACADRAFT_214366 [Phanerochaete carnosa HHB-10118-sp]
MQCSGIIGLVAGGSGNFVPLASLLAVLGVGVGGNLPVGSAVFLDFVPGSHQYLLTILTVRWSLGQLFVNLIAWPLITNFSCPQDSAPGTCTRSQNMSWRYPLFTLGGFTLVLWALRFFAFALEESPRYLVGRGRDADAVAMMHRLAAYNGKTCSLTVEQLRDAGELGDMKKDGSHEAKVTVLSRTYNYTMDDIKALFETKKLAWSTSLLVSIWGIICLASTFRGAQFGDSSYYIIYRNQVILNVLGTPGAFLAGWAIEQHEHQNLVQTAWPARGEAT